MPPAPPTTETGYAGVSPPPWSAFSAALDDTDVPALIWPNNVGIYHRMRNDGQIAALTWAVTVVIESMRWRIHPRRARDEVVAEIAADFQLPVVGESDDGMDMRRERFMHSTHLSHALLGLWYGHMFFQMLGDPEELASSGSWRLRKLSPRMPQSLERIHVSTTGGLAGISQKGYRPLGTTRAWADPPPQIPVAELAAYVWRREGAAWWGRSMLRPLYPHWLIKDMLMRVDALKHERFGLGVPYGEAPAGGKPSDYATLAQSINAAERAGVGLPQGARVGIAGITGTLPDTIASLRYHDEQMARTFLAMFMQLGQTETGSRALGESFLNFFDLGIEAVCRWYADTTTAYVIADQVEWNYGPDEPYPAMTWERPEDAPLGVDHLGTLIEHGALTVDPEVEAWVRSRWRLPPKPETDEDIEDVTGLVAEVGIPSLYDGGLITLNESRSLMGLPPVPDGDAFKSGSAGTATAAGVPASGPIPSLPPQTPIPAMAPVPTAASGVLGRVRGALRRRRTGSASARRQTVDDTAVGHREPFPHEVAASVDFTTLQREWQDATTALVRAWGAVRDEQVDALMDAIVAAVEASDAQALALIQAPVLGADVLRGAMLAAAEDAMGGALAEATAQGLTLDPVEALVDLIEARAQSTAALMARGIGDAAARQAINRYGAGGVAGMTGADVAAAVRDHLDNLSDAYLNDMLGGALTEAQNTGRIAVMAQAPGRYYASELLDGATCGECAAVDGREYADLTEASGDYPCGGYSECEGGPRCRGTIVAVYDEATPS